MKLRACFAPIFLGLALQAQGCWPLVPPPPPPPNATPIQLAEWPATEWAGQHQTAVLRGLFRDDLSAPPDGATVILIRCFPAFMPPYQLEVIQRAGQAWTLKGWFLRINLIGALADLKLKSPALSDADAIAALRIPPVEIQADPEEWVWLKRFKPGMVLKLPRAIPRGTDGTLICWLESAPKAGTVEAQLQDGDSLSALSGPINRLEKRLRAVHGNTSPKTHPEEAR